MGPTNSLKIVLRKQRVHTDDRIFAVENLRNKKIFRREHAFSGGRIHM